MFRRLDPFGNPTVGVYVRATSRNLFLPPGLTKNEVSMLEEALGHEAIQITLGGSSLVGSLMAANERGAIVADFVSDDELDIIQGAGLQVHRLTDARLNAAGNNILANDHGAVIHPEITEADAVGIQETLGVDCHRGTIGDTMTVGTAAVATNKGVLVHPKATEDELAFLKGALHAPAQIGTVNHGHGLVGAGMTANQHGAACGTRTTGIELGRIEEALQLYEETP